VTRVPTVPDREVLTQPHTQPDSPSSSTTDQVSGRHRTIGTHRLKARLGPMRRLKRHRSAQVLAAGHAFVQNLRRGHYEIATEVPSRHRPRIAFYDLGLTT
jgi:hypothetical protein